MKNIIFIGTLHMGITPSDELIGIIAPYKPDQLLVEIEQKDIDISHLAEYPPEMIAAYNWAVGHKCLVTGFDADIGIEKGNLDRIIYGQAVAEQMEIISQHNWKDFNKPHIHKLLDTDAWDKIIDHEKRAQRQKQMKENIEANVVDGTNVIVAGAGHIPFFTEQFPEATFPLS